MIAISDELGRLWRHKLEAGELVDGVEWIGGLSFRHELDNVSFGAFDIIIGQVVLGLVVQSDVKHARP